MATHLLVSTSPKSRLPIHCALTRLRRLVRDRALAEDVVRHDWDGLVVCCRAGGEVDEADAV